MKPSKLKSLVEGSPAEIYGKGEVFHSLDFEEKLYLIESGFVKRCAVREDKVRVIEAIYGPDYFFPLTAAFNALTDLNLGRESVAYIYQAMTDVEIKSISNGKLVAALKKSPELYADLFYEAGRRLKANINRLSSNTLHDDYEKVTHQLAFLAEEFGQLETAASKKTLRVIVPLEASDMAEQLNISVRTARSALTKLEKQGLVSVKGGYFVIPDHELLKDAYL